MNITIFIKNQCIKYRIFNQHQDYLDSSSSQISYDQEGKRTEPLTCIFELMPIITAYKMDLQIMTKLDFEFFGNNGLCPTYSKKQSYEVLQPLPKRTIVDKLEELRQTNYTHSPSGSIMSYSESGPVLSPKRTEGSKSTKKTV